MSGLSRSRKLIGASLIAAGLVLVGLGLEGAFTDRECYPGVVLCGPPSIARDTLAVIVGLAIMIGGTLALLPRSPL